MKISAAFKCFYLSGTYSILRVDACRHFILLLKTSIPRLVDINDYLCYTTSDLETIMGKIQPHLKIQPAKDVIWKVVDGDGILLNLKSGDFFGLNETALRIWKFTNGERTAQEITTLLANDLEISLETANRDTKKIFDILFHHKLIETV